MTGLAASEIIAIVNRPFPAKRAGLDAGVKNEALPLRKQTADDLLLHKQLATCRAQSHAGARQKHQGGRAVWNRNVAEFGD
jgi:hypothetical protein